MKSKLLALAGLSALVGACAGAYDSPDDEIGGDERILHFPESDVQVALRDDGSYTITFDHLRQIERTAPSFDLRLARGTFDPRAAGAPPAIAGLDDRPAPGADVPRLYLVQFATQPIEEYRVRLGALGATSHQYLPRSRTSCAPSRSCAGSASTARRGASTPSSPPRSRRAPRCRRSATGSRR
jgi:hypothetical protein